MELDTNTEFDGQAVSAEPLGDSDPSQPVVRTRAGAVRGLWRGDSAAFLGIPFAEAPVGERRFAAPVPHSSWEGVRDATAYGATPQRQALSEVTLIPEPSIPGESTLNVNVFTPRPGDDAAALPVLVYIHGGGFVAGSPASPWYDGAAFNRDGIVTVSVSYRLGFDGFGWIEDAPHNRGILDWILALEWVRDNIAEFGGDPRRVTIAGQSAGGAAVLALCAIPRATDLFARAISISGPDSPISLEDSERNGRALAERAGVPPTRAGLSTLSEEQVLQLQNGIGADADSGHAVEAEDADRAEPTGHAKHTGPAEQESQDPLAALAALTSDGLQWGPVVDGELVPETVSQAFLNGVGGGHPLVLGTTDNEFNMALASLSEALAGVDPVSAFARFGVPRQVAEAYVASHPQLDTAETLGQFVTDAMFRAPNRALAELRARAGLPTWLYRFSWKSPVQHGAVHCLDVPFFFDCLQADRVDAIAGPNPPLELAVEVHGSAVRFIAEGDPGWPAYDLEERATRAFGGTSSVIRDGFSDVAMLAPHAQ